MAPEDQADEGKATEMRQWGPVGTSGDSPKASEGSLSPTARPKLQRLVPRLPTALLASGEAFL